MNGQPVIKREWKEIVEETKIMIHNTKVSLAILEAQLVEAKKHK